MNSKQVEFKILLLTFAIASMVSLVAQADIVVSGPGLTDFDPFINGSATYTHAINLGNEDVTVNGVVFDSFAAATNFGTFPNPGTDAQSGNTFAVTGDDHFNFLTSGGSSLTGASAGFANGLAAVGAGGTDLNISLDGLIAGNSYQLNLFYMNWDGSVRTANLLDGGVGDLDVQGSFTSDGTNPGGADNRTGTLVTYVYVAEGSTHDFTIRGLVANSHPHLHAFSNQAIPEPATTSFLAMVGIGLLSRRQRLCKNAC